MKFPFISVHIASTLAIFLAFASFTFGQDVQLKTDLGRSFAKFDVTLISTGTAPELNGGERRFSIQAAGRNFDFVVTPNDIRSPRYRTENDGASGKTAPGNAGVNTFKGSIAGSSSSEVRLTIDGTKVEGFFDADGECFFIEPAAKYSSSARSDESVVYQAKDSLVQSAFYCDSDLSTQIGKTAVVAGLSRADAARSYKVIELATDADLEYVQTLGGAAQANTEILSVLNMVEGTYNSQLGLSIRVVFQHTWTTADPYAGVSNDVILNAFTNYWNTNYSNVNIPRDAAHLFTAKSAALSRGLAWVGVMCNNPLYSYGLSGYVSWEPGKFLIPAHEIGHNLGANHAEAAQSCASSLMNAQLSNTTPMQFCTYSQAEINSYVIANGSCMLPGSASSAPFDFDGDGRADQAIFRPGSSVWYINRSSTGFTAFQFGSPADRSISADFDGDGKSDPAVYRGGIWYRFKSATNTVDGYVFGLPTDIPVPADLNGDGKAEIVIFRPETGDWHWLSSVDGSYSVQRFGSPGDIPLPGDYDGDGKADFNVFRPSTGVWYRLNSSTGSMSAMQFGTNGDKPVSGDFDGDGKTDTAIYRPSTAAWYVYRSGSGSFYGVNFGLPTDIPSPGDFDCDGKTDSSVFRPSDGVWYRLNSANGQFVGIPFGQAGDQTVEGYYVR
ncbi:MAG: FG-GAP-like repeat-containing protein [Pyrinomonadaceae bacterium]